MDNSKISDKQKKLLKIIGIVLLVVFLISVVVIESVIKPTKIYNEATALLKAGDTQAAYDKFYSLEGFKDSRELCFLIKYNEATELKNAGKTQEAYNIFSSISTYKDSQEICFEIKYEEAEKHLKSGHIGIAYNLFNSLDEYRSSKEKAAELLKEHPYLSIIYSVPGDEFTLGKYEQDNILDNGAENIEWIVLDNTDGVLYAVSKYVLDTKQYNTHNGEGSTLKAWLKDDFSSTVFSDISDNLISKVCLLSADDMSKYSKTAMTQPEWTPYSKAQNPDDHFGHGYSWWIEGDYSYASVYVDIQMSVVTEGGSYEKRVSALTSNNGVRPAIIIDYTSSDKDYYADDYEDIKNAGVTTRTEDDVEYTGGSTKCTACNGIGRIPVKWYSEGDWGEISYTSYECTACGGDGRK